MQWDGNSFYGDIVLDGVNMAYRDEDSIVYQMYEKQILSDENNDIDMFLFKGYLKPKIMLVWEATQKFIFNVSANKGGGGNGRNIKQKKIFFEIFFRIFL